MQCRTDEGFYECDGNAKGEIKTGSFKFRLFGKRLKGSWTLVKFKEDICFFLFVTFFPIGSAVELKFLFLLYALKDFVIFHSFLSLFEN